MLSLRQVTRIHDYKSGYLCGECGEPTRFGKQVACHGQTNFFRQENCTAHVRLSEFFNILTKKNLWPVLDPQLTLSDINREIQDIAACGFHKCEGGDACHLRIQVKSLGESVNKMVTGVQGLGLEEITFWVDRKNY